MRASPKLRRKSRPGFWAGPEIRRYLPVAIGVLAVILLALTFAVAPRGRRRPVAAPSVAAEWEPATISEESADLRRSPDSRSETVVTLRRGSAVTIVQRVGTWLRVREGAREGFLPRHSVERDADRAL